MQLCLQEHLSNDRVSKLINESNEKCGEQMEIALHQLGVLSDRLTCRQVLNILVILGFMLNYMLRVNLTIAIVSMVIPRNESSHPGGFNASNECVGKRNTIAYNSTGAIVIAEDTAKENGNGSSDSFSYFSGPVRCI